MVSAQTVVGSALGTSSVGVCGRVVAPLLSSLPLLTPPPPTSLLLLQHTPSQGARTSGTDATKTGHTRITGDFLTKWLCTGEDREWLDNGTDVVMEDLLAVWDERGPHPLIWGGIPMLGAMYDWTMQNVVVTFELPRRSRHLLSLLLCERSRVRVAQIHGVFCDMRFYKPNNIAVPPHLFQFC